LKPTNSFRRDTFFLNFCLLLGRPKQKWAVFRLCLLLFCEGCYPSVAKELRGLALHSPTVVPFPFQFFLSVRRYGLTFSWTACSPPPPRPSLGQEPKREFFFHQPTGFIIGAPPSSAFLAPSGFHSSNSPSFRPGPPPLRPRVLPPSRLRASFFSCLSDQAPGSKESLSQESRDPAERPALGGPPLLQRDSPRWYCVSFPTASMIRLTKSLVTLPGESVVPFPPLSYFLFLRPLLAPPHLSVDLRRASLGGAGFRSSSRFDDHILEILLQQFFFLWRLCPSRY